MIINVFYTTFLKRLDTAVHARLLNSLTTDMRAQIIKYRHWQDAHRYLFGKSLLITGVQQLGFPSLSLEQITYNRFQKPFYCNGPHFNISHAGNVVVCAINTFSEVGIDVEEVKPIPLSDFNDLFAPSEMDTIFKNSGDYTAFYNLWTQKEAFLKAIGTGLNIPLNRLTVSNKSISYNNETWYLKAIEIEKDYICHVATKSEKVDLRLVKVDF